MMTKNLMKNCMKIYIIVKIQSLKFVQIIK